MKVKKVNTSLDEDHGEYVDVFSFFTYIFPVSHRIDIFYILYY